MQSSWLVWVGTLPLSSRSVISRPTKWISSRSNKVVGESSLDLPHSFWRQIRCGDTGGFSLLFLLFPRSSTFGMVPLHARYACGLKSCQGPLELLPHQYLPVLHKGNVLVLC